MPAGNPGIYTSLTDVTCARALFAELKIGDEIQRQHFAAVAAAIRFAEKMRQKAKAGW